MPPPNSSGKPGRVDEPLAEPLARPPYALCLDPPKSGHWPHHASGHVHRAGYGAVQYLKPLVSQCACCNSGFDEGLSESAHDYKNKPPVGPQLSEEALWPSVFLLPSETRLQLAEPRTVSPQQSYCPKGWNNEPAASKLLGNVAIIQNFLRITKINIWSLLATRGEECIYIPL